MEAKDLNHEGIATAEAHFYHSFVRILEAKDLNHEGIATLGNAGSLQFTQVSGSQRPEPRRDCDVRTLHLQTTVLLTLEAKDLNHEGIATAITIRGYIFDL